MMLLPELSFLWIMPVDAEDPMEALTLAALPKLTLSMLLLPDLSDMLSLGRAP